MIVNGAGRAGHSDDRLSAYRMPSRRWPRRPRLRDQLDVLAGSGASSRATQAARSSRRPRHAVTAIYGPLLDGTLPGTK